MPRFDWVKSGTGRASWHAIDHSGMSYHPDGTVRTRCGRMVSASAPASELAQVRGEGKSCETCLRITSREVGL